MYVLLQELFHNFHSSSSLQNFRLCVFLSTSASNHLRVWLFSKVYLYRHWTITDASWQWFRIAEKQWFSLLGNICRLDRIRNKLQKPADTSQIFILKMALVKIKKIERNLAVHLKACHDIEKYIKILAHIWSFFILTTLSNSWQWIMNHRNQFFLHFQVNKLKQPSVWLPGKFWMSCQESWIPEFPARIPEKSWKFLAGFLDSWISW